MIIALQPVLLEVRPWPANKDLDTAAFNKSKNLTIVCSIRNAPSSKRAQNTLYSNTPDTNSQKILVYELATHQNGRAVKTVEHTLFVRERRFSPLFQRNLNLIRILGDSFLFRFFHFFIFFFF